MFPTPAPEYSRQLLELWLKVKCTRNPKSPKAAAGGQESYLHSRGESCDHHMIHH